MGTPKARLAALLPALVAACSSGAFDGLARAPGGSGPRVQFDLSAQPDPVLPFPNDLAARVDPSSATGLRVNARLSAPTRLGQSLLAQLDRLDGFGTFSPITVSFDRDLDLPGLLRLQNDADPGNDAVYLIDLTAGQTVPLEVGGGRFPAELVAPGPLFASDPLAAVTNLLFPVDGPLPNLLHPPDPLWAQGHGGVPQQSDDLLTFYERSTHTLILRPLLPLAQRHTYAVVLTDRLVGQAGAPVVSPFTGINHAAQTGELQRLPALLPAGLGLGHVAFTWAFTTQSITSDLEQIALGLEGAGPLAELGARLPVVCSSVSLGSPVRRCAAVCGSDGSCQLSAYDNISTLDLATVLDQPGANGALLTPQKLLELLTDPQVAPFFGLGDPAQQQALTTELQAVAYFVAGTFPSPDLLADPDRRPAEQSFAIDPVLGATRAQLGTVPFLLAVPRADPGHCSGPQALPCRPRVAPFPVVIAGHRFGASRLEPQLAFAGTFARFGLATFSLDAWGHGLAVDPAAGVQLRALFAAHGLAALADALLAGRAHDAANEGVASAGGDFWNGDPFHSRDALRQTVVDWLQASRLLRSFDGHHQMLHPSGGVALAGDFDLDGVPDVGGGVAFADTVTRKSDGSVAYQKGDPNPGADQFAFGVSLGGLVASVAAAVEPSVRAVVPVAAGGGLADLVLRTSDPRLRAQVLLEQVGPLVTSCSWSVAEQRCGGQGGVPALVFSTLRADAEATVPIAPLALQPGDRVTACDLAQLTGLVATDEKLAAAAPPGCVTQTVAADGSLRLALQADGPALLTSESPPLQPGQPNRVAVLVTRPGDLLRVLVSRAGSSAGPEVVSSFAWDTGFEGVPYAAGAALRVPGRGLGRERNTPGLRRQMALWQWVVGPADPIDYAPHWSRDPLPLRQGAPVSALVVAGAGDPLLPTSLGVSLGRAAGLVDGSDTSNAYGRTVDQLLLDAGVIEGLSRLHRLQDPGTGPRALLGSHLSCAPPADCSGDVLVDPSGLSCDPTGAGCTDGLQAPRLQPPLRALLQRADLDATGSRTGTSMLLLPLLSRAGRSGIGLPQPQQPFDIDLFLATQAARFFESRGSEIHFEACQATTAGCP